MAPEKYRNSQIPHLLAFYCTCSITFSSIFIYPLSSILFWTLKASCTCCYSSSCCRHSPPSPAMEVMTSYNLPVKKPAFDTVLPPCLQGRPIQSSLVAQTLFFFFSILGWQTFTKYICAPGIVLRIVLGYSGKGRNMLLCYSFYIHVTFSCQVC